MDVIDIGSRRELFVDRFLLDPAADAALRLHEPVAVPEEAPLPGAYVTVIRDGGTYKRYYRVSCGEDHYDGSPGEATCVDLSADGKRWTSPELDLFRHPCGMRNIVWAGDPPRSHNFCPFLDARPGVPASQRYKALAGTHKDDGGRPPGVPPLPEAQSGLFAFGSPDGIVWRKLSDRPVLRFPEYAFDSQNVAFWSETERRYVCYFRCWEPAEGARGGPITGRTHLRSIARAVGADFLTWEEPVRMRPNLPGEHLYTSQAHPYFRAPHILIALPTRFHPGRGQCTDVLFMSARGAEGFDRTFLEAFVRPGPDPEAWKNRANYASLNVVPLDGRTMAFYVRGIRRELRTDGFASLHAGTGRVSAGTKPVAFGGDRLTVNFSTSAGGSLRIGIHDAADRPIPGFSESDCEELFGDEIDREVRFAGGGVGSLAGRPVRLLFILQDADLYSFRFRPEA